MDAKISSGASGRPCASVGFSRNAEMRRPSGPTSMTPNWSAIDSGWRMPATVTAAPDATWSATIWDGSIR